MRFALSGLGNCTIIEVFPQLCMFLQIDYGSFLFPAFVNYELYSLHRMHLPEHYNASSSAFGPNPFETGPSSDFPLRIKAPTDRFAATAPRLPPSTHRF